MKKELSKDVLKRWVKDYNLPIKLYQEPYFTYLINLYDDYLGTLSKFELLEDTVKLFKSEDKFLSYYYDVRDNIIQSIKSKPEFIEFNEGNMDKFNILSKYPKHDIYKNTCNNKYFVSIDLVKANFQALRYINPEIISNANTYEEFIGMFTELEYLTKSKYLRQVIFGNMNPKRQIKVERYLIEKVIDYVCLDLFDKNTIQMATSDEVVFEISEDEVNRICDITNNLTLSIKENLNIQVDIEVFKLTSIDGGYVKEFKNKIGYELKGVTQIYFPQVYKKYNNLELDEKDLVFFHEGQLATFLEPVYN